MPMTRNSAPAPSGSQTTTTFQLGLYNPVTDTFTQSLDLNDQVTYFLKPGKTGAANPKLEQKSTAVRAENVRVEGSLVVKDHLDNITCTAAFTIKAATPQGVSDAWNAVVKLIKGQQATKGGALCLRFAWPQSANYSYLDIQYAAVTAMPGSPLEIQAKASTGLVIALEGGPAWRGDRLTYQNLVPNAGFEYPIGGTLAPAVLGYSDAFANVNAYNPQQYRAAVLADAPLRYYEFDELSGTTANDAGSQAQNGTYNGTFTLAQTGALGGPDKAVLLDGSTAYISLPTTGLPSGNGTISLEAMVNIPSNPGTTATIMSLGTSSSTQSLALTVNTTGHVMAAFFAQTPITSTAALSFNAWHHVAVTWDATTLTLYLDGASTGTPVTPGTMAITYGTATIGRNAAGANFFPGTLDKCAIYGTALSSGRVGAHNTAAATGPATTAPANTFTDVVYANTGAALKAYYRLGLADDSTHAYDIAGSAQTGTPTGSPTQGATGLVSGDTDTAYTLNGTTQYVTVPTTNLPTGANPWTMLCRAKPTNGTNSGDRYVMSFGDGGSNGRSVGLYQVAAGGWAMATFGGTVVSGGTSAAGVSHTLAATYDGSSFRLYVDGSLVAGPTAPGVTVAVSGTHAAIGSLWGGSSYGNFFPGTVDEAIFCNTALGATAISNIHTAANSGASGNLSNAISFPAGAREAFGSSVWGALQTWAVRFRYATSQVSNFYLHYTDANNNLEAQIQSGANGFKIVHTVASVSTTVAQATVPLQHEAWYWLQATQLPTDTTQGSYSVTGPWLRAVLSYDSNGAVGTAISTLTGTAASYSVALRGQPQIAPTGAALVAGGISSGLGNAWYNWGPGGWRTTLNGGTGAAALAWDGATAYFGMSGNGAANTYTGGPTASNGAARIDAALAGTLSAKVQIYRGSATDGTPGSTMALPVATAGDVLEIAGACRTNSVSGTATLSLSVTEYNSSGTLLRTDSGWSPPSKTAAQAASWVAFPTTTYTTGTGCAYVDLACVATDSTVNSAGNAFWFDNIQCQDLTATGTTGMPYCELRSPNSPAQLQISGVQGTMPAPSMLALGTYNGATLSNAATFAFRMGKRLTPTSGAVLVTPTTLAASVVLDSTSYGGYYNVGVSGTNVTSLFLMPLLNPTVTLASLAGIYRTIVRYQSKNSTAAGLTLQTEPLYSGADTFAGVAHVPGYIAAAPIPTASLWTIVDLNQIDFTLKGTAAQTDTTKIVGIEFDINTTDTNTTGDFANSAFLLPVDSNVVSGQLYNPVGGGLESLGGWFFCYLDGLKSVPGWGWNLGKSNTALAEPSQVVNNAAGTSASWTNLTLGADPYLQLDPTTTIGGTVVNQFTAHMDDASGQMTVMPIVVDLTYSPLWHAPR